MPTFNSKEYEWNDISINVLGRTIRRVSGIKYTQKKEKSYLYGRGNAPLGIQTGNESTEGELTLLHSEVNALEDVAKVAGVTVLDLQFDIVVAYALGNVLRTDIVKGASITDYEIGYKQGDKNIDIPFKFMALGIQRGV